MAKKEILWVDDDEDLTLSLKLSLEQEGWQVKIASSAGEGKVMAAASRPDLIIMDIIMEGEHGYKAIKDILSNHQLEGVPLIVFSSVTQNWGETTASREDALLSDADEFVDKSDGIEALISTIHKYIDT